MSRRALRNGSFGLFLILAALTVGLTEDLQARTMTWGTYCFQWQDEPAGGCNGLGSMCTDWCAMPPRNGVNNFECNGGGVSGSCCCASEPL